ncbi:hypothetical protein SAMN05192550_3258 [Flavobacterium glycines]|uniref:Uncharacterized protein n=1 Tax=Flavobacterium glycines TaxID=551990 RepID=A0A1G8YUD6_9FLAO|nr:hypothetical protein SAMN05192550_3258 [Flavobacterium glycines]
MKTKNYHLTQIAAAFFVFVLADGNIQWRAGGVFLEKTKKRS